MSYCVQFVGLVCFLRERGGRRVLLPDGREPGFGIDPHYGSIAVPRDSVVATTGWSAADTTPPGTFTLPPCEIVIEGCDVDGPLETTGHDGRLPELRKIDPNFEIDPARAETIASMRIRQGTLAAYHVPDGSAIISELTVPHDGAIRITISARDGSGDRTIDLEPGTEIAITNTARHGYRTVLDNDHFRIYEKLSARPVTLREPSMAVVMDVPKTRSRHPLFTVPRPIGLTVSCSNTGCC